MRKYFFWTAGLASVIIFGLAVPIAVGVFEPVTIKASPSMLLTHPSTVFGITQGARTTNASPGWEQHHPPTSPLLIRNIFIEPDSLWASGRRALEVECHSGQIYASASGTVAFIGQTPAGQVLSLSHQGNFRTIFTGVTPLVKPGQMLRGGELIAVCERDTFKWSARIGKKRYFDPLLLLLNRVMLLPDSQKHLP